jgi:hypothetical protein
MKQGQYLKEIVLEFKPTTKLNIEICEQFLSGVVSALKVEETHRYVNDLAPGFDILIGLKESCIYFGYWQENDYVRLIVSSCKKYKEQQIVDLIKLFFLIKSELHITVNSSESIKDRVKRLWG